MSDSPDSGSTDTAVLDSVLSSLSNARDFDEEGIDPEASNDESTDDKTEATATLEEEEEETSDKEVNDEED